MSDPPKVKQRQGDTSTTCACVETYERAHNIVVCANDASRYSAKRRCPPPKRAVAAACHDHCRVGLHGSALVGGSYTGKPWRSQTLCVLIFCNLGATIATAALQVDGCIARAFMALSAT